MTLVDVLYENRIRLFCSAEGDPMQLFQHVVTMADARRINKSDMVCHHSKQKCCLPASVFAIAHPVSTLPMHKTDKQLHTLGTGLAPLN